ncbi:DNA polymerase IV [Alkalihalobacillus pseudalcaliphilus]|uniref:DNA polymerase IV n=1 Tax=Alkalihalobacillus pseudalcaliphilus TaxID=79884 RepID=UPI00064DF3A2|nr:DNA polymerase IV [Alkalihalobacillus pseudalcaliphilus]KMK76038.1 DNA polymerase IV [Alkalihalobacillus pseudalcaliphilus]
MSRRVIFHIDMNSFYASVEMAYNPDLKNKPIAIAGNVEKRKGIIVTSSYEARAKGVKTTMPVWKALKLCPNLILLPPHFQRYKEASQAMFELLKGYTPLVEPVSIDEGFLDATYYLQEGNPIQLAEEIQSRLLKEMDLPCSIGIAPNKFLAKMASDMKKPKGITVLRKRDIPQMLWPLDISEMYGIGKRTVEKWKKYKITTIGELALAEPHFLEQHFGSHAIDLKERAQGIDNRVIDPNSIYEFKSIGHSTTLPYDTMNEEKINKELKRLAQLVELRLKRKGVCAFGVQLMIRYADWKTTTKSYQLDNPIQSADEIYQEISRLFLISWNNQYIRLLGISTYDLVEQQHAYKQLDLFHYKEEEKKHQLKQMVDQMKAKFGADVFVKTDQLSKKEEKEPSYIRTSFQRDFLDQ